MFNIKMISVTLYVVPSRQIAAKINAAVKTLGVSQRFCDDFSVAELNQIMRDMHCHFSPDLASTLPSGDARAKRFTDLAGYEASWLAESTSLGAVDDLEARAAGDAALRDGKCAEVHV
jgi:hypothetical protein